MHDEQPTFEASFARLQEAIELLEQGGLPLEKALDVFEESMRLVASCHQTLDRAELRLTQVVEEYPPEVEARLGDGQLELDEA